MEATDVVMQAPSKTVMFVAKRLRLKLVKDGIEDVRGANGRFVSETKGDHVQFEEGVYRTEDEDKIAWLRSHPRFGDPTDGFFEIGATVPDAEPLLQQLTMAVADRDVQRVADIYAAEEQGYQRESVLMTARAILEKWEREDEEPERDEPSENQRELDPTSTVLEHAHPEIREESEE